MDGKLFDEMSRRLADGTTRRETLRMGIALVASGLGLSAFDDAEARTWRRPGEICRKNDDCASNVCGPRDSQGRRRCLCRDAADCPQPSQGSPCASAACDANGICGIGFNVGATCDDGNACTTDDICDERGGCSGTPVTCPAVANGAASCGPSTGACVTICDQGFSLCGTACVDVQRDPNHCGTCDTVCTGAPNATPVCSAGICGAICLAGFGNCDADSPGCETNLLSDRNNCGSCGNVCATTSCNGGQCKAALAEVCSQDGDCLSGACFEQRCIPLLESCPPGPWLACFDNGLELKWCCGQFTSEPQCVTSNDCPAGWLCRTTGAFGRTCWQIAT